MLLLVAVALLIALVLLVAVTLLVAVPLLVAVVVSGSDDVDATAALVGGSLAIFAPGGVGRWKSHQGRDALMGARPSSGARPLSCMPTPRAANTPALASVGSGAWSSRHVVQWRRAVTEHKSVC